MKKFRLILTGLFLLMASAVFAQNITVKGVVTEAASGDPMSGVDVLLKGSTSVYALTDNTGAISLNVPATGVLVISCIGYQTVEVPVAGKAAINVALEVDAVALEETIVVAFGTSTKEAFTGSAKVVGEEKLSLSQVTNATSALAGQVAGVQLVSSNGAPGSSPTIRIRGISSIYAGNDPLIVVDGVPYDGDINNIAPSDIESMTVLKDAASNALYGARGANGVIMITTKKGKMGDAVVSLDVKIGGNTNALRQYDVISNPAAYYEQQYKGMYNYYVSPDGLGLSEGAAWMKANQTVASGEALGYQIFNIPQGELMFGHDGKLNPNATLGNVIGDYLVLPDDWAQNAYRTGLRQEYTLTISGAQQKLSYYASLSYLNNQGITEKSDYSRLSARVKADYQAKKWLKTGVNFSYAKYDANSLGNNGADNSTGNVWAYTSQIAPIYPLWVRNADGTIYKDANGIAVMDHGNGAIDRGGIPGTIRPFITDANPLLATKLNTRYNEGNAANIAGYLDFKLYEGLTVTVNAAANLDETRYTYVYNPYYGQFRTTGGTVSKAHGRSFAWNSQQIINYKNTFSGHGIDVMVGHEYYNSKYYELSASKSQMFSQENLELDGAVVDGQGASSYTSEYNNEGILARLQYNYMERIFVSGSYRRDASSKFHPSRRWGNFWSAGAAWIISKEPWFNAKGVDELKIKASIGSQGNDNIGSYRYTDRYAISPSDGKVSVIFDSKGNKDITWETNTNINAGVEFGFLNGAITGGIEYFNRLTTDMLFPVPVAPSQGYTSIYQNVGKMSNQGLEVDLNFGIFNTRNVRWDINVNLTYLKNQIVQLSDKVKTATVYDLKGRDYKGFSSGGFFLSEGEQMYSWYTYEFAGVDQETGKSLWYMDETNADGLRTGNVITTDNYSKATKYLTHKSTLAPVYGGFGTSLNAYGVDFAINFTYQIGGVQWDGTYQNFMYSPTSSSLGHNFHKDLYNSWTPENPSNTIPRFQYQDSYANAGSTRWLTDASYLNLQNINIGYTFPAKWTKKILISSLRIYASAENVWYWSARQGFDPRQSYGSSTSASNYSPMRTVSGGITIKF